MKTFATLMLAAALTACLIVTPAAAFGTDGIMQFADGIGGMFIAAATVGAIAPGLHPVRLLQTAMIDGKPRSPAEGIQYVTKAERDRLVDDVHQAVDADDDVEAAAVGAGDGLEDLSVTRLRKIAVDEGALSKAEAATRKKPETLAAAIRERRALFAGTDIDPTPDDDLRTTATNEGATVADDADTAALVGAIGDRRSLFADTGIDAASDDGLRQVATDEGFTVAEDADTPTLIAAIRDGRAAKA